MRPTDDSHRPVEDPMPASMTPPFSFRSPGALRRPDSLPAAFSPDRRHTLAPLPASSTAATAGAADNQPLLSGVADGLRPKPTVMLRTGKSAAAGGGGNSPDDDDEDKEPASPTLFSRPRFIPSLGETVSFLVFCFGLGGLVASCPLAVYAKVVTKLGLPHAQLPHVKAHAPTEAATLAAGILAAFLIGFLALQIAFRGHTGFQNMFRFALCGVYAAWAPAALDAEDEQLRFIANTCVLLVGAWDVVAIVKAVTGVRPLRLVHGYEHCPFCSRNNVPSIDIKHHIRRCAERHGDDRPPKWANHSIDEDSRPFVSRYTYSWMSGFARFAFMMPGYLANRKHYFAVPPTPLRSAAPTIRADVWERFTDWRRDRVETRAMEARDAGVPLTNATAPVTLTGTAAFGFFAFRTTAGRRFLYVIPLKVAHDVLAILAGPVFVNHLIRYVRGDLQPGEEFGSRHNAFDGIRILLCGAAAFGIQALVFQGFLYHVYRASLDATTTIRTLLHTAATVAPMYARSGYGHGDVIAMATVDARRVGDALTVLHNAWSNPFMVLLSIYALHHFVGYFACGAALGTLLGLAYINREVIAQAAEAQAVSAAATSARSSDTADALQCIRAIKFTGWESSVMRSLNLARDTEAAAERVSIWFRALTTLTSEFGTALAYVACFVTYFLFGGDFDSALLVPAVVVLGSMRQPIWTFPANMATVLRGSSSASRVASFLANVAETLNHRRVTVVPPIPTVSQGSLSRMASYHEFHNVANRSTTNSSTGASPGTGDRNVGTTVSSDGPGTPDRGTAAYMLRSVSPGYASMFPRTGDSGGGSGGGGGGGGGGDTEPQSPVSPFRIGGGFAAGGGAPPPFASAISRQTFPSVRTFESDLESHHHYGGRATASPAGAKGPPPAVARGGASIECAGGTTVAPHPAAAFQLSCTVDDRNAFRCPAGCLVYLAGPNASGKSTFLRALAGEACITNGDMTIRDARSVAYLPQTPWLFNGTVRENILAGAAMDRTRYQRVLAATALNEDVAMWDRADEFEVGNAGSALSGGQRTRVALARACYADAELYLLDDTLSTLDEGVQLHIVRWCFQGLLQHKTRIYSAFCDPTSDGAPQAYIEVARSSSLSLLVNPNGRGFTTNARAFGTLRAFTSATYDASRSTTPTSSVARSRTPSSFTLGRRPRKDEPPTLRNPATVEAANECRGRFGVMAIALVAVVSVLAQASMTSMDASVGAWSSGRSNSESAVLRSLVVLGLLGSVFSALRVLIFFRRALDASTSLHKDVITRVVHASLWWVEAPARVGAITAVLTKDQDVVDHSIPESIEALWAATLKLVVVCLFNALISQSLLCLLPPMFIGFYTVTDRYLAGARDIRRLEAIVKNDAVVCLANALRGGPVARGINMSQHLHDEHDDAVDAMNAATNAGNLLARWVGLRLEAVAVTMTLAVACLAVASRGHINAAFAGVAVGNCITTTRTMLILCRRIGMFQSQVASVEQLVALHASIPPPIDPKELPMPELSSRCRAATGGGLEFPVAGASGSSLPFMTTATAMAPKSSPPTIATAPHTTISFHDDVVGGGSSPAGHGASLGRMLGGANGTSLGPNMLTPSTAAAVSGDAAPSSHRGPMNVSDCALIFDRVAVRYPGMQYDAVADVSFRVGLGEHVALVGRTGAGKSTLVSALLGHAVVTHGAVVVLGKCVADGNADVVGCVRADEASHHQGGGLPPSLRHLVGVVPQDPMLMPRLSWRQHLVAAGTYVPDDAIRRALRVVGLARLVTRTLDDTLEDSGAFLTPAQAQLLSFARVLCLTTVKLIILDEPSACVDGATEGTMIKALREMPSAPAVLFISHGGRVLSEADRVVDLTALCELETPIGSLDMRYCSSF